MKTEITRITENFSAVFCSLYADHRMQGSYLNHHGTYTEFFRYPGDLCFHPDHLFNLSRQKWHSRRSLSAFFHRPGLSGQLLIYLMFFTVAAIILITMRWKEIPTTEKEITTYSRGILDFHRGHHVVPHGFSGTRSHLVPGVQQNR